MFFKYSINTLQIQSKYFPSIFLELSRYFSSTFQIPAATRPIFPKQQHGVQRERGDLCPIHGPSRILGVAYGFTNLDWKTRAQVKNLEGTTDSLDDEEARQLKKMIQSISIISSAVALDSSNICCCQEQFAQQESGGYVFATGGSFHSFTEVPFGHLGP